MLSAGTRCLASLRAGAHRREHDIPLLHISVARSHAPLLLLETRPAGHESRALLAGGAGSGKTAFLQNLVSSVQRTEAIQKTALLVSVSSFAFADPFAMIEENP